MDNMNINGTLRGVINHGLEELNGMEVGTEEYKEAVNSLSKLIDKVIEMDKLTNDEHVKLKQINSEVEIKREQIEAEKELKSKQIEFDDTTKKQQQTERRKEMIINGILSTLGIIVPAGITVWGAINSWRFEKDDSVTSTMGRGFMNKLLNPKK